MIVKTNHAGHEKKTEQFLLSIKEKKSRKDRMKKLVFFTSQIIRSRDVFYIIQTAV